MEIKHNIGGLALLEGIMMIGPGKKAVCVRKPDGTMEVTSETLRYNAKLRNIPFLRGVNGLFNQMVHGMKAMMYAAEFYDTEEDPASISKFEHWIRKRLGDKFNNVVIYISVILAILFSVGLFILLPNLLVRFLGIGSTLVNNLIEGGIRILVFFTYVLLVSRMKDIRRVWMYHGAEHKTINCYERGLPITPENVRTCSTDHKRCGTSFMFVVIIISIFVFALTGWHSALINALIRILLIPVVAGISYEIVRLAWKRNNWITVAVGAPGRLFQRFTSREPEDDMLDVAIAALKEVIPQKEDSRDDSSTAD